MKHKTSPSKTKGGRKEIEFSGGPRRGPRLGESKQICNVGESVVKLWREGGNNGEEQNREMGAMLLSFQNGIDHLKLIYTKCLEQ